MIQMKIQYFDFMKSKKVQEIYGALVKVSP